MLILCAASILLLTGLFALIVRDVSAAPFISLMAWLLSFVGLLFTDFRINYNSNAFLFILIGILINIFGFLFGRDERRARGHVAVARFIVIKVRPLSIFITAELILSLIMIVYIVRNIPSGLDVMSLYTTIRSTESEYYISIPIWMQYSLNIIPSSSVAILAAVFSTGISGTIPKDNKCVKLLLITQFLIGLLCSLLKMNRNGILIYLLPVLMVWAVGRKVRNAKLITMMLIGCGLFALYFLFFSIIKYGYQLDISNIWSVFSSQFLTYLSSPIACFQRFFDSSHDYLLGSNTFRTLLAILSVINPSISVPELVQSPLTIANGVSSNVYTVFHYYYLDFGGIYSLLILGVLGVLTGVLYRKAKGGDPIWVYLYSLSIYPAFMQFFQDQYFSLLSTWIQFGLIGLLICKTNLFFDNLVKNNNVSKSII